VDFSSDFFGAPTVSRSAASSKGALCPGLCRHLHLRSHLPRRNSNTPVTHPNSDDRAGDGLCRPCADAALAEEFFRYLCRRVLEECPRIWNSSTPMSTPASSSGSGRLPGRSSRSWSTCDAITELQKAKVPFAYPVAWGLDLQTEHERYLTEQVVVGPTLRSQLPERYQGVLHAAERRRPHRGGDGSPRPQGR